MLYPLVAFVDVPRQRTTPREIVSAYVSLQLRKFTTIHAFRHVQSNAQPTHEASTSPFHIEGLDNVHGGSSNGRS